MPPLIPELYFLCPLPAAVSNDYSKPFFKVGYFKDFKLIRTFLVAPKKSRNMIS